MKLCKFSRLGKAITTLFVFGITALPAHAENLLVGNTNSNAIELYNGDNGAFLDTFVTPGSGGLSVPTGFNIGPDGNLYVNSLGTNSVNEYNIYGQFLSKFVTPNSGGLRFPLGSSFGPDGNLYVASGGSDQILRYNGQTGAFIDNFAQGGDLKGPYAPVFGPDGALYVSSANNNEILRYNGKTGAFLNTFAADALLNRPAGMTFGPDGNLYVSNSGNNNILSYNLQTGVGNVFATGGLQEPVNPVFGPSGDLYVASEFTNNVLRYDGQTGQLLNAFVPAGSGGLSGAGYIAFANITPTPVPETASPFGMLAFGAVLAVSSMLKRQNKTIKSKRCGKGNIDSDHRCKFKE